MITWPAWRYNSITSFLYPCYGIYTDSYFALNIDFLVEISP